MNERLGQPVGQVAERVLGSPVLQVHHGYVIGTEASGTARGVARPEGPREGRSYLGLATAYLLKRPIIIPRLL